MALNVYRVYNVDNVLPEDAAHLFSIVTTENSAAYAIPSNPDITDFEGFDEKRIEFLLSREENPPTTPEEWALVASQNMSMLDVIPVSDVEYETVEEAILEEGYLAEDAWYFRNPDRATPVVAAAGNSCPPATQDIALNLKNRKNAIDTAMYGPLNPEEPNEEYWQSLADEWKVDVETAKKQRCGNCAVFVVTTDMRNCIAQGLEQGGSGETDAWDAIDTAQLGYCEAFDFKCAASRTCRAWVAGGPIDDNKTTEE
jgi:hypothetical protein